MLTRVARTETCLGECRDFDRTWDRQRCGQWLMLMKFPDVLEPSLQPREGLVRRCAEGHCVTAFYPNCFYRFKLTVASYCQDVEIMFQKSI